MYCGTDVIEVERVKNAIEENEKILLKLFTQKEIQEIEKTKSEMKYQRYAGRFAAKEAVFKAVSKIVMEENLTLTFYEIEIVNDERYGRRPTVAFLDSKIEKVMRSYEIDLSISHIKEIATAVCILVKKEL